MYEVILLVCSWADSNNKDFCFQRNEHCAKSQIFGPEVARIRIGAGRVYRNVLLTREIHLEYPIRIPPVFLYSNWILVNNSKCSIYHTGHVLVDWCCIRCSSRIKWPFMTRNFRILMATTLVPDVFLDISSFREAANRFATRVRRLAAARSSLMQRKIKLLQEQAIWCYITHLAV